MRRILVTGANGFIGKHLMPRLRACGYDVVAAGRHASDQQRGATPANVVIGDLGPDTDWARALDGRDTVLHLAGQVPRRGLDARDYTIANDAGTKRLAEQARAAGVTRFVYLSSLFAATDKEVTGHVPDTSYGRSKRAAEAHLREFAGDRRTAVSLRPPLVYGDGATGNWAMLQKLASLPFPLPFASVHNRRNVIAVENLVGAILRTVDAPDTGGLSGSYPVADTGTVSLADMLTWLRAGLGRGAGLFPAPVGLMRLALQAAGQGNAAQSLLGDLWADTTAFKAAFAWEPALSSQEAMTAADRRFRA